jgi:DNA replication protein DnaC
VLAAREWWAMRPTPCLVLAGGVGTGKTVASLVVLRAAAAAGLSARYLRASTAARMGAFGPESAAAMRDWCTVGVLAIDDLGSELANQAWQAALTELLDTRLSDGLATVVTTNATPAALLERYGERVTDRLRQSGTAIGTGTGSLRRPAF